MIRAAAGPASRERGVELGPVGGVGRPAQAKLQLGKVGVQLRHRPHDLDLMLVGLEPAWIDEPDRAASGRSAGALLQRPEPFMVDAVRDDLDPIHRPADEAGDDVPGRLGQEDHAVGFPKVAAFSRRNSRSRSRSALKRGYIAQNCGRNGIMLRLMVTRGRKPSNCSPPGE